MSNSNTPYVFSACAEQECGCNPALSCNRIDFFSDEESCNPYARAHVVPQIYKNCADAEYTLMNGTFFNDLYMPYTPTTTCACARSKCK